MKRLFALFVATILAGASAAHAVERHPISSLSSLNFDGTTLSFSYGVGGGCQPHTPQVKVRLLPPTSEFGRYTAIIAVEDVTPAEDPCEAFLSKSGQADLRALIWDEAEPLNLSTEDLDGMDVVLPPVKARMYE